MRVRNVCLGALVATVIGLGAVRGQSTSPAPYGPSTGQPQFPYGLGGPYVTPETVGGATPSGEIRSSGSLSRWIQGTCPDCCGPVGGNGEIMSELYVRSGPVFPFGNGPLGEALDVGWAIHGGGRVLFFNECGKRAWTVDVGGGNMFNNGSPSPRFIYVVPPTAGVTNTPLPLDTTVKSLNRTFVSVAGGMEYYLVGEALQRPDESPRVRVGFDVGGRYGTEKIMFGNPLINVTNSGHSTDIHYALFAAAHADVEIPRGACTFIFGLRAEYDYTFSTILGDANDGDVQDLSVLVNAGIRF